MTVDDTPANEPRTPTPHSLGYMYSLGQRFDEAGGRYIIRRARRAKGSCGYLAARGQRWIRRQKKYSRVTAKRVEPPWGLSELGFWVPAARAHGWCCFACERVSSLLCPRPTRQPSLQRPVRNMSYTYVTFSSPWFERDTASARRMRLANPTPGPL